MDCSHEGYITYTALDGDTPASISRRFSMSENWLRRLNGLKDNTLTPGLTLAIRPETGTSSRLVRRGRTGRNEIALTYDCGGPNAGDTGVLLDVLNRHGVKATFFLVGKWAEQYSALSRSIADGGHEIGNHSFGHPDYTQLSMDEIQQDVRRGEEAIRRMTGAGTRPLFRFPFGYHNVQALQAVGLAGYSHSIHWSIDPRDWEDPPLPVILRRVLQNASAGDIVLLHPYSQGARQASNMLIRLLADRGFRFVTVSEII